MTLVGQSNGSVRGLVAHPGFPSVSCGNNSVQGEFLYLLYLAVRALPEPVLTDVSLPIDVAAV